MTSRPPLRLAANPDDAPADIERRFEPVIKMREAAWRIGCSPKTVRRLLESGVLEGFYVGIGTKFRHARVYEASVDIYLKLPGGGGGSGTRNRTPPPPRRVRQTLKHRETAAYLASIGAWPWRHKPPH